MQKSVQREQYIKRAEQMQDMKGNIFGKAEKLFSFVFF